MQEQLKRKLEGVKQRLAKEEKEKSNKASKKKEGKFEVEDKISHPLSKNFH